MEKECVIELMDKIEDAAESIKSLRVMSLLLLDACKSSEDDVTKSILFCYYRILMQAEEKINKCSVMIGHTK